METDHQPAAENPDQASSDHEQGTSPARSYECIFCKRGFSNAQALGGHMNIHRRDKAKLKQASPSETNQQSPDITKIVPSYSPNHPSSTAVQPIADARSGQERRSPGKWPWVFQDDDDVNKEIRQLPLFDEKPSITDQNPSSQVQGGGIGKGLSSSQGSSESETLDLELRLGPEPQDSSPTMTTKKFF
ncbi:hypothetical protein PTKIN_Ptkin03bG0038200 [Pterospermum kingtungense]